eukprot:TRINITY_DN6873_c0_g1_i1.p1 TRINITY_DN6873_c0_g1~~TRINITY_DN6873_c0_g1_i1.p1  ORF type:complete len:248 (+),score=48.89 TRINITY_DN6873_c0_g1_i1:16-759(+)
MEFVCEYQTEFLNSAQFYNCCISGSYIIDFRERDKYVENSISKALNLPPEDMKDDLKMKEFIINFEQNLLKKGYYMITLKFCLYGDKNLTEKFIEHFKKFPNERNTCFFYVLEDSFDVFVPSYGIVCSSKNEDNSDVISVFNTSLANHIIHDFLFLGNLESSHNEEFLEFFGIDHIVNASNMTSPFEKINYLEVKIDDYATEDISEFFDKSNEFIFKVKNEGKKMFGALCCGYFKIYHFNIGFSHET